MVCASAASDMALGSPAPRPTKASARRARRKLAHAGRKQRLAVMMAECWSGWAYYWEAFHSLSAEQQRDNEVWQDLSSFLSGEQPAPPKHNEETMETAAVSSEPSDVSVGISGEDLTAAVGGVLPGVAGGSSVGPFFAFEQSLGPTSPAVRTSSSDEPLRGLIARDLAEKEGFPDLFADIATASSSSGAIAPQVLATKSTISAKPIDLEWVQSHPTGLAESAQVAKHFSGAEALCSTGGIILEANGKRFANELGHRSYVAGEMWKNKPPFRLCLTKTAASTNPWKCRCYIDMGLLHFYESGEALAKDMGIAVTVLEQTYEDHHQAEKNDNIIPGAAVKSEPFYVAILTPVIHYNKQEVKCNYFGSGFWYVNRQMLEVLQRKLLKSAPVTQAMIAKLTLPEHSHPDAEMVPVDMCGADVDEEEVRRILGGIFHQGNAGSAQRDPQRAAEFFLKAKEGFYNYKQSAPAEAWPQPLTAAEWAKFLDEHMDYG